MQQNLSDSLKMSLQLQLSSLLFLLVFLHESLTFIPVSNCGSTFFKNSGQFSTPTFYYTNTSHHEKCQWRISGKPDEKIVLNINEIEIEKTPNCSSGSVEVRDGYWEDSPLLGKYCGTGSLNLVESTGNKMFISYKHKTGNRGFSANYQTICGELFYVRDSFVLEPFKNKYPLDKKCVWKIIVPDQHQVVLKFQKFQLEKHNTCFYDYVEILDGLTENSTSFGKFCGNQTPSDIISTSNTLLIKFTSDSSIQKDGFSALILAEYNECTTAFHGCTQKCINTIGSYKCGCRSGYELHSDGKNCKIACGGILTAATGQITSPSFPDVYPPGKTCTWEIVAEPENLIGLNFTHFDLEGENFLNGNKRKCRKDKLKVFSSEGNQRVHRGTYCGNVLPDVVTSESNKMIVVFAADNTTEKTGFSLNYFTFGNNCDKHIGNCHHKCVTTSVQSYKCVCPKDYSLAENERDCYDEDCHFEISSTSGNIHSPNWRNQHPYYANCSWKFKTTPGHKIKIDFSSLQIEDYNSCYNNFIAFYDGPSESSNSLGKFCNSNSYTAIISTSNELYMRFKTDVGYSSESFYLQYSTICGGSLKASEEEHYIFSHANYVTQNYSSNIGCEWTIVAPAKYNTTISIEVLEIEDSEECEFDFIEILERDVSLGKFCGTNRPLQEFVSDGTFTLRFVSDASVEMKGFRIMYKAVQQDIPSILPDVIDYNEEDLD